MTERELKKLGRGDLLEMLLELSKENDKLREELAQTQEQLASRTIEIENAGSLAEAALQLNGIFEAAQAACEQYRQNIEERSTNQKQICEQMENESKEKCERMEQKTREECQLMELKAKEECDRMLGEAKQQADAALNEAQAKVKELYGSYAWFQDIMENTSQTSEQE